MTAINQYLQDLKQAGNNYLNSYFTRAKYWFWQSSTESRQLALALSNIDINNPQSLVTAVSGIKNYINKINNHENTHRFFDDYLKPILESIKKSPLQNIPDDIKLELQRLELASLHQGTDFSESYSALLFDGMGYGETMIERSPNFMNLITTEEGCNTIAVLIKQKCSPIRIHGARILKYFFAQPNPPELTIYRPKTHHEYDTQTIFIYDTLRFERTKNIHDLLRTLKPETPQVKDLLPIFLYAVAKTDIHYYPTIFGTFRTDATEDEIQESTQAKIGCLKELKRLGLNTLNRSQLASLLYDAHDLFIGTQTTPDLTHKANQWIAITLLKQPLWKAAVLDDINSEIHLTKIISATDYPSLNVEIQNQIQLSLPAKRAGMI